MDEKKINNQYNPSQTCVPLILSGPEGRFWDKLTLCKMLKNKIMKNNAQKFWDKQAKRFDDRDKQFKHANQELIAETKKYLNANDIVLDFGCATGTKTLKLAAGVKQIHGLDFSAEMISEAIKKKDKINATNVSFSQGTIYNDELEKVIYDKIIAFSIIHLLEDSEKAIQRIYELLKPGGLFISETACFKDNMNFKTRFEFTAFRIMRLLGIFPLHLNMFKTSDVEKLLTQHCFHIVKEERFFFNGMSISFMVAEKQ
ncbi:MAG TPA: class I SAM-dependent methyltransferase [Bacteroidales bacterium]|nr:class I SAM-dependent methyltransferase [Bacteroidales bacterium]